MTPGDSSFLVFTPFCNPFTLCEFGPSVLLNKIKRKWWDVTYKETVTSIFLSPTLSPSLWILTLEASRHATSSPRKRSRGKEWTSLSNSLCRPETQQQPPEWASRGGLPHLTEMAAALANILFAASWETLSQKILLSHAWIPDPQELWDNKCLLF